MRKILAFLAIISLTILTANAVENFTLRGYDGVELPEGTMFQVVNMREFSTKYCDDTTKVAFVAVNDTYMYETNIVPAGTEFYGYIEKMNEPVVGTNASMVISINKLKLPDGFEIPIKGYIYSNNKNLIGGELTEPARYIKMPHYQKGLGMGTTQYVPGATRKMGQHLTVAAGADLIIMLSSPAWITHTLTN